MKIKLKNGLTLLYKKKRSNTVTISILVKVGSNHEHKGVEGISHFIEHLLFEGTKKRTAEEISNTIESLGGEMNAFTSHEETVYFITLPKKHFDVALEILSDMIQNPIFDLKILEKERKVILEEINLTIDDPKFYQYIFFLNNLYEEHPTKNAIYGNVESMRSITRKNIIDYYKEYYSSNNTIVSIVGDINNIKEKVESSFKNFKQKRLPKEIKIKEPSNKNKITHETRKILHSYLVLGYKTNGYNEDFYTLEVIRSILGRGQSGRLFNEIRGKRGLAYSVGVSHDIGLNYGYFAVHVGMDKKNISLVKKLILKELKNLKHIKEEDIKDAKTFLEGNFIVENEDNRKEAITLAKWEMLKDFSLQKEYIKKINKVTKKDILSIVHKYLNDEYTLITIQS
tara:strand:- start:14086 stop:15279 length:1194 start_codon:yes stop_codon:yes gene_type:complete